MDLRWPDSGSLLDALFSEAGDPATNASGGVSGATPVQLDQALAALQRGNVEYVILEDGPRFMQAADAGDGPYQVQVTADGETMHDVDGGADATTMPADPAGLAARRRRVARCAVGATPPVLIARVRPGW